MRDLALVRWLALFLTGAGCAHLIHLLQLRNNVATGDGIDVHSLLRIKTPWILWTCGFGAVLVGSLVPLLDRIVGFRPRSLHRSWNRTLRALGSFIALNFAANKLSFDNNYQMTFTLSCIAIGTWFLFDRTRHGFLFAVTIAVLGTWIIFHIVAIGAYTFTRPDFFGVRSWIPCMLFSSSIAFGSLGRQLQGQYPPSPSTLTSPTKRQKTFRDQHTQTMSNHS